MTDIIGREELMQLAATRHARLQTLAKSAPVAALSTTDESRLKIFDAHRVARKKTCGPSGKKKSSLWRKFFNP